MTFLDCVFLLTYIGNYILAAASFSGYTYMYNRLIITLRSVANDIS